MHRVIGNGLLTYKNSTWCQERDIEMEHIKPPNEMDFSTMDGTSVAEKWRRWRQTMELFIELSMSDKSEKEKCSAFLYIIGQAGRDIFNAFVLTAEERDKVKRFLCRLAPPPPPPL